MAELLGVCMCMCVKYCVRFYDDFCMCYFLMKMQSEMAQGRSLSHGLVYAT